MGIDLGTYFLRLTYWDGRGYIQEISTGHRLCGRLPGQHPLERGVIPPTYDSEQELIELFLFQYRENNWSCDCNRSLDMARAYDEPEREYTGYCLGGPLLRIKKFEILNPEMEICYSDDNFETEHKE